MLLERWHLRLLVCSPLHVLLAFPVPAIASLGSLIISVTKWRVRSWFLLCFLDFLVPTTLLSDWRMQVCRTVVLWAWHLNVCLVDFILSHLGLDRKILFLGLSATDPSVMIYLTWRIASSVWGASRLWFASAMYLSSCCFSSTRICWVRSTRRHESVNVATLNACSLNSNSGFLR